MANEPVISRARMRRGIVLFALFSSIGILFLIYRSSFGETITRLKNFDLRFLALAVTLFLVDLNISGLRIWMFARKVQPDITYGAAVRSCLANIFLGGVTPSQTGGAAAQIYVLYREGMTLIDSTVVCFLGGFLGTSVVLSLCAIIFSLFVHPEFVAGNLQVAARTSLTLFSLITVIVLLSLASPSRFKRVVGRIARAIPRLGARLEKRGLIQTMFDAVDRYHGLMRHFMLSHRAVVFAGIALSAMIYLNKFAIAWVVVRGLGLEADFWQVIYMQVVLILIFYFSPTPGASGLAEVSTAAVMGSVVPAGHRAAFILLWRFFTLVAGMLIGALVTARYLFPKDAPKTSA